MHALSAPDVVDPIGSLAEQTVRWPGGQAVPVTDALALVALTAGGYALAGVACGLLTRVRLRSALLAGARR
jgi:hypothetical protein